jgi:glycosyltransferase involved in cell wall biosynthesis
VSSWSIRAARLAGAAVLICPHGTLSRYTLRHRRTAIKRLYLSLIERSNISLAEGLHFTTDTERDEAAWHGVNLADRSYVVPPPFVPDTHPESDPARRDEKPMVLFLSRIHKVKNVEALLRAWEIVIREVPHARLVIAGQGPDALVSSLEALSERLGIEKTVSFTGFAGPAEKARLFAEAKVLALPSHHENFGLVVLEAIAAGLPVVISPEVQLGPFVTTHGLGLVSQTDPPSLAAALRSVMSDATLQRRVATQGESLVREHYSPEAIGPALMTMYVSALARRTAST